MNIYDRMMAIGTKMTEMDASTYQGAFIGKIIYGREGTGWTGRQYPL